VATAATARGGLHALFTEKALARFTFGNVVLERSAKGSLYGCRTLLLKSKSDYPRIAPTWSSYGLRPLPEIAFSDH
jgi:hypothetical protein